MRHDRPFTGPAFAFDGAEFSACERYRYLLWRRVGGASNIVAFIGLNPSTATATEDDPTIRRCKDYAARWGAGLLIMANAYAWRSTDRSVLPHVDDPVGPDNDRALARVARHADIVVASWGKDADRPRVTRIGELFDGLGRRLQCLKLNKDGSPQHPLYLRKNAIPFPWDAAGWNASEPKRRRS